MMRKWLRGETMSDGETGLLLLFDVFDYLTEITSRGFTL
jgi:hypothetical protein